MPVNFGQYRRINAYTVPSSFLSLRAAILLLFTLFAFSTSGYVILEKYTVLEAFYMTVITFSTVGFSEIRPLSNEGRVFTTIVILLNIGIYAYLVSVFSYYIIQGEIFKKMHTDYMKKKIDKLKKHVIVCGYGKYGHEITSHLMDHDTPFVIIDQSAEAIEHIRSSPDKLLYIHGDATQDEVLEEAGINRAEAIICALPDDSENVFIVITAKNINPRMNIISRAKQVKSKRTLLLAGASHVIMPEQIGGFYMATLVSKPGAVEFFTFITRESESDISFEEIRYEDLPQACQGKSIKEMGLRKHSGANIIGKINSAGNYDVNPTPNAILAPAESFIVLGNHAQIELLKGFLSNYPERD